MAALQNFIYAQDCVVKKRQLILNDLLMSFNLNQNSESFWIICSIIEIDPMKKQILEFNLVSEAGDIQNLTTLELQAPTLKPHQTCQFSFKVNGLHHQQSGLYYTQVKLDDEILGEVPLRFLRG